MIHDLRTKELSLLQHGGGNVQKTFDALVPLGLLVPFFASRQTTAEEPGCSARFDTVCHSNKETGTAGEIGTSDWGRE